MGCFSYLCKECGKGIMSDSFSGERVKLFHLKKGKVIQEMEGEYDSYGAVFTSDKSDSFEWKEDWNNIVAQQFGEALHSGIAAIHTNCYIKPPDTRSENDPNQGWGEHGELFIGDYED